MSKQPLMENQQKNYTIGTVASSDGTIISYRQLGHGPGLVLVHGTMESAQSHMQLAEALSDAFTVYLPDRRGRGLSGPYRKNHSLLVDVADLEALLMGKGAHYICGVSVGSIICLQAALSLPIVHKTAVFEPPFIINGSISTGFLARYDEEIAQGNIASALVTAMKGAQMGPPIFNIIPRWLLKKLTGMIMASEDKKADTDYVSMRMLAPTIHYDHQLSVETEDAVGQYCAINTEVLMLGSSKSPGYFRIALDALAKVLPSAKRVVFQGLHHGATGNKNRGGQPERVAQELRRFFG